MVCRCCIFENPLFQNRNCGLSLFSRNEAFLLGRLAKKESHALFFRVGPTLPALLGPAFQPFFITSLLKPHPGPKYEQQNQKTDHTQQAEQRS